MVKALERLCVYEVNFYKSDKCEGNSCNDALPHFCTSHPYHPAAQTFISGVLASNADSELSNTSMSQERNKFLKDRARSDPSLLSL